MRRAPAICLRAGSEQGPCRASGAPSACARPVPRGSARGGSASPHGQAFCPRPSAHGSVSRAGAAAAGAAEAAGRSPGQRCRADGTSRPGPPPSQPGTRRGATTPGSSSAGDRRDSARRLPDTSEPTGDARTTGACRSATRSRAGPALTSTTFRRPSATGGLSVICTSPGDVPKLAYGWFKPFASRSRRRRQVRRRVIGVEADVEPGRHRRLAVAAEVLAVHVDPVERPVEPGLDREIVCGLRVGCVQARLEVLRGDVVRVAACRVV